MVSVILKASYARLFTISLICLVVATAALNEVAYVANVAANALPARERTCPSPTGMRRSNMRPSICSAVSCCGSYFTKSAVRSKILACVSNVILDNVALKVEKY